MASELERLLLRFEADTAGLRSALRDMDSAVDKSERNVTAKLSKMDQKFASLGSSVSNSLRSLAAGFAAAVSVSALNNLIDSGAKLQNVADTVGLTAEKYQQLSFAAREAGVEQSQFDQAMMKLATSVSEARQQTGGFYEFLRGRAPDLLAQIQGSKDLSDAMGFLADKVAALGSAEDRALISKQAFGEGAVLMTKALEGGRAGLDAAAASAQKFGAITSNESLKAVKDLNTEIDKLGATIKASLLERMGQAIPILKDFVGSINKIVNDTEGQERFRRSLLGLGSGGGKEADLFFGQMAEAHAEGWKKVEAEGIKGWTTITKLPEKLPVDPRKFFPGMDAVAALRQSAAEASGRDLEAVTMQYEQELEKFRRMMDDKILTEKQFAEARALLGETMQSKISQVYEKETQQVRELANEFKSGLGGAVNGVFDSIIQGSFRASDAIRNLVAEMAKMSLNRGITQPLMDYLLGTSGKGGAVTGMLSSVFGNGGGNGGGGWLTSVIPQMAHGGPMTTGRPYIAGEAGPELIVPNTAAQVMPGWAMGGGGGGSTVYNIDARNADAGVEQRIYATLARVERERANPIAAARTFSQRFPTRR